MLYQSAKAVAEVSPSIWISPQRPQWYSHDERKA
eukprot:COSAG04_NODE_28564_length_275_cov_0.511364_1_plen_33_part_01